ncbi:glycerophosphodiester phosphodiesterase [Vibrio alginolyticus]
MHPLQNGSQSVERPPKKPLVGTPGWFTESGNDNLPSYPGADWFNDVIAEFFNMLDSQGITFDPSKDDHLSKAFDFIKNQSLSNSAYFNQISNDDIINNLFFADSFQVSIVGPNLSVNKGFGYVKGLRVFLEQSQTLSISTFPSYVYVDAAWAPMGTGNYGVTFQFTVTPDELNDYVDGEIIHKVTKIANVLSSSAICDLRVLKKNDYKNVLIYAHRGGMRGTVENTLYAFSNALNSGAHGVEADIAFSSEGTPYIFHDLDVSLLTNGSGNFYDLTDSEIDNLRFKSVIGTPYENLIRIPKLTKFIEFIESNSCFATVEVKLPRPSSASSDKELALKLLAESSLADKITVQTTSGSDFEQVRNISSKLLIAFSYSSFVNYQTELPYFYESGVNELQINTGSFSNPQFSEMLSLAKQFGFSLISYTSNNNEHELKQSLSLGFNSIISDRGW